MRRFDLPLNGRYRNDHSNDYFARGSLIANGGSVIGSLQKAAKIYSPSISEGDGWPYKLRVSNKVKRPLRFL